MSTRTGAAARTARELRLTCGSPGLPVMGVPESAPYYTARMPFDPNASFGKSLFFGEILEDQLFPYPEMPREQAELVAPICESIDKFMAPIDTRRLDRTGEMPNEVLQSLREIGLFGLIVPEEHGGLGLSNTGYARVMQEVAGFDGSIAVTLGAHSSIGFKGLLLFGTAEQ